MSSYAIRYLESTAALREAASDWDDLWRRGDSNLPTAQAELIAQWIDRFAPRARFVAAVVEENGRFVAALPLFAKKLARVLPVAGLPGNPWTTAGDLLLDPSCDAGEALRSCAAACAALEWPLLWLDDLTLQSPQWIAWKQTLADQGLGYVESIAFPVGTVQISGDWETYLKSRSRHHRRYIRVAAKRAEEEGTTTLRVLDRLAAEEVEPWLRTGFEIEDRGWKHETGTSVLQTEGIFDYYLRQARLLAERNQLCLVFLEHSGRPIAFEYGWIAKGVYFSPKVGYDPAFQRISPGQLLRAKLLEHFFAGRSVHLVDFAGQLSEATARWITGSYDAGRLVMAPSRAFSRGLLHAYQNWWPWVKKLRPVRRHASAAPSESSASPALK